MFFLNYSVSEHLVINTTKEALYNIIGDFNTWRNWSPWIKQDPEVVINISQSPLSESHSMHWQGQNVGVGELMIEELSLNQKIKLQLKKEKPWKSKSVIDFTIKEKDGQCEVTWNISARLPFFLFMLKKSLTGLLAMDIKRGLLLLKDYIEMGKAHSESKELGKFLSKELHFLNIKSKVNFSSLPEQFRKNILLLNNYAEEHSIEPPVFVGSFYHNFLPYEDTCEFSIAYGYNTAPLKIENDISVEVSSIPSHKTLTIEHKGPYRHLGNTWAIAFILLKKKKLKIDKKIPIYEFYMNDPHSVPEQELITQVHIPIK